MNVSSSDPGICVRYHIHCADCGIRVSTAAIGEDGNKYCSHCYSVHILSEMSLELRHYWLGTQDQKNAIYRFYCISD